MNGSEALVVEDIAPVQLRSAEDQVYEALREQIVRGTAPPMTQLRLSEIAASLGVSTMPVRVALRRLEVENLVVTLPRRVTYVAPLHVQDIEEIQAIRLRIEGLAARLGAPHVDRGGLARMRGHLKGLRRAIRTKDMDSYVVTLREFELICYEAAGSARLLRMIEDLRRAAERYLRIAVAEGGEEVLSIRFWDRFYEAVAAHDGERAEAALTEALTWTLEFLRRHFSRMEAGNTDDATGG